MITKGGHGSGITGHRTTEDSVLEMDSQAKKNALSKLKAEQAKRAGKAMPEPELESKLKDDTVKQLTEELITKIIQRVKEKLAEQKDMRIQK